MNALGRTASSFLAAGLTAAIAMAVTLASDPPETKVNPVSQSMELASAAGNPNNLDIRHVIIAGTGPTEVFPVSTHPYHDRDPHLAIGPAGDTWVVWWRDGPTDRVIARKRTLANRTWSGERLLDLESDDARSPAIVHDGHDAVVVFEIRSGPGTSIAVNTIDDEPDPIPTRSIVAVTSHEGDCDTTISSEGGHLWVTWIDSASTVGWSQHNYASGTWSAPAYEPSADGVEAARERIRHRVLGS
jgi:hypothetical protein